jgi:cell division septal protein FtsQ
MTTLNVSISKLEAAVSQYGYVERLMVSGAGAHGLVIHVVEQVPVASVEVGSQSQVVDAGGYLLRSTTIHETLPTVPLKNPPDGQSVTATGARAAIAVLAAAPYALLTHVESATSSSAHGVIVQLRNGPKIYFGPAGQLAQKWTAAIAVLQNKDSSGAAYVDVSDPMHPAAGVGISPSRATALGLASSAITSSSNTVSAGG